MATTDLSIINAALTRTGEEPITSLSGTSVSQKVASQNYDLTVEAHLSVYPWKRASKIKQLSRLDEDEHGEPPEPWTAAYQLPADLTEIRTVKIAGLRIAYEVHGDTVLCDAADSDEVILHYVWRAEESSWPPWFREGMIRRMEAIFLRGIGERYVEAKERDKAADDWFEKAEHRDSQSQPARDPIGSPTLRARTGTPGTRPNAMPTDAV